MTITLTGAGVLSAHVTLQRTESPRDRAGTIKRLKDALWKVSTAQGADISSDGGEVELDASDAEYLRDLIDRVHTWPHQILCMDGGPQGAIDALKKALDARG